MADKLKICSGIVLTVMGAFVLVMNFFYNLRDIIILLGVIVLLFGLFLIASASIFSKSSEVKKVFKPSSEKKPKLKVLSSNGLSENLDNSPLNVVQEGFENTASLLSNKVRSNDVRPSFNNSTSHSKTFKSNYLQSNKPKDPKHVLDTTRHEPTTFTEREFVFTPNYERPMKVIRTPKKRSENQKFPAVESNTVDLNRIPKADNYQEISNFLNEKDSSTLNYESDSPSLVSDNDEIIVDHGEDNISPETPSISSDSEVNLDDSYIEPVTTLQEPKHVSELTDDSRESLSDEEIKIDPNNPESIPIPMSLKSFIVCAKGTMTTQEAFEEISKHAQYELLFETPSLKDMSHKFLSHVVASSSKIIIQESDFSDLSHTLVLSCLMDKGAEIRTMPVIHTINLIADNTHALIVSDGDANEDFQYGAVYNDEKSINEIKDMFYSTWDFAEPLDIRNLKQE